MASVVVRVGARVRWEKNELDEKRTWKSALKKSAFCQKKKVVKAHEMRGRKHRETVCARGKTVCDQRNKTTRLEGGGRLTQMWSGRKVSVHARVSEPKHVRAMVDHDHDQKDKINNGQSKSRPPALSFLRRH